MYNLRSRRKSERFEAALKELAPKSRRRSNGSDLGSPICIEAHTPSQRHRRRENHDDERYDEERPVGNSDMRTPNATDREQRTSHSSSSSTTTRHIPPISIIIPEVDHEEDGDHGDNVYRYHDMMGNELSSSSVPGTPVSVVSVASSVISGMFRLATGVDDVTTNTIMSDIINRSINHNNSISSRDRHTDLPPSYDVEEEEEVKQENSSMSDVSMLDDEDRNEYCDAVISPSTFTTTLNETLTQDFMTIIAENRQVQEQREQEDRQQQQNNEEAQTLSSTMARITTTVETLREWYDHYHYAINKLLFTFQEVTIFMQNIHYIKRNPTTMLLSLFFVPSRESTRLDIKKIFEESSNISKAYLILCSFISYVSLFLAWRYLFRIVHVDDKGMGYEKIYAFSNQLTLGLLPRSLFPGNDHLTTQETIDDDNIIRPILDSTDVSWNIYVVDNMMVSVTLLILYHLSLFEQYRSPKSNIVVVLQKTVLLLSHAYRLLLPLPQWIYFCNSWKEGSRWIPVVLLMKLCELLWLIPGTIQILGSIWKQKRVWGSPVEHPINDNNKDAIQYEDCECCICFETLQDPISLECRHIFCENCITLWMKQKKACPICRSIPGQAIQEYPYYKGLQKEVLQCDRIVF